MMIATPARLPQLRRCRVDLAQSCRSASPKGGIGRRKHHHRRRKRVRSALVAKLGQCHTWRALRRRRRPARGSFLRAAKATSGNRRQSRMLRRARTSPATARFRSLQISLHAAWGVVHAGHSGAFYPANDRVAHRTEQDRGAACRPRGCRPELPRPGFETEPTPLQRCDRWRARGAGTVDGSAAVDRRPAHLW